MTKERHNPYKDCHYRPDPVQKCTARRCLFADRREELPEDPDREEDDGVVAWRMGASRPQRAAGGARGLERADRARREAREAQRDGRPPGDAPNPQDR